MSWTPLAKPSSVLPDQAQHELTKSMHAEEPSNKLNLVVGGLQQCASLDHEQVDASGVERLLVVCAASGLRKCADILDLNKTFMRPICPTQIAAAAWSFAGWQGE